MSRAKGFQVVKKNPVPFKRKPIQITEVTLSGQRVRVDVLICPLCKRFDLDLTGGPCEPCVYEPERPIAAGTWGATCTRGHHWHFPAPEAQTETPEEGV